MEETVLNIKTVVVDKGWTVMQIMKDVGCNKYVKLNRLAQYRRNRRTV